MRNYEDPSNILREMLLSSEAILSLTEDEFEKYSNFINERKRNKIFTTDMFGERLSLRTNTLYNLISPFFFKERFINYTKANKLLVRIAGKNSYEDISITFKEPLYIFNFMNMSGPHVLTAVLKYLKISYKEFAKINLLSEIYQISDECPENTRDSIFVRSTFGFKIKDISFMVRTNKRSRYSKYIHFDEILSCPSRFIENNDTNKKNILSVVKRHGLGVSAFVKGMKFTEQEIKKVMIPAISKTRNTFLYSTNKETVFVKLIETQSHMSDELVMEIIGKLSNNQYFMKKLKKSKKVAKAYLNRPIITLFMVIS